MNQQLIHHVPFHAETLIVVEDNLGDRFVVMKPIVEALGLSWSGQLERIKRDEVLAECSHGIRMQVPGDDQAREVVVLEEHMLQGWLFTLQVSRTKPEIQEKLRQYRRECFDVLHSYFTEGAAWNPRFHQQEFDMTKKIAGKQTFDMAPVAFAAISRAAERVTPSQCVEFAAKALGLADQCLARGEPDQHVQEHLLKLILDTGETLHPDEVSALTRTTPSQRSRLLRRLDASGYSIYKNTAGQYGKFDEPIRPALEDDPEEDLGY